MSGLTVREPEPATVAAAAAGDVAAFTDLVHLLQVPVWRFLTRLLGDRGLAEDVTQETFVRVHRGLATFGGRSRFSTWVFGIARNAGLDALRARSRRPQVVGEVPLGLAGPSDGGFGLELADALARLTVERREALLLVAVLGLGYREVAEITGTPEGTVKSRVHAARAELHAALIDEGHAREV